MMRRTRCLQFVAAFVCVFFYAAAGWAAQIVIIKNSTAAEYNRPAALLVSQLSSAHKVEVVSLGGASAKTAKAIAQRIAKKKPALMVALGDKAAYLANHMIKGIPFVFGATSNWRALGLNRERAAGVENILAPETLLSQIKMFFGNKKRIGVVYTDVSKRYVENALKGAGNLKLTLLPIFVTESKQFQQSFSILAKQIDVFWLVRDPKITTAENLRWLIEEATDDKVPTVCHSPSLVSAGLLMSVVPDPAAIAFQIVAISKKILTGTPPKKIPVSEPANVKVTMNKKTLQSLKIRIDDMLFDFVEFAKPRGDT